MPVVVRQLTLLSRTYCHLCHDMEQQVRARLPVGWSLNVLDIDQHPALEEKYDERVPVLLAGEFEVFHYFFDALRWQSLVHEMGAKNPENDAKSAGGIS